MVRMGVPETSQGPSVNGGSNDTCDDGEHMAWRMIGSVLDLRTEFRTGFSIELNNNDKAMNSHTSQLLPVHYSFRQREKNQWERTYLNDVRENGRKI